MAACLGHFLPRGPPLFCSLFPFRPAALAAYFTIGCALLPAGPAHAAPPAYGLDGCPPLAAPDISVTSFFEPPLYNFQNSIGALKQIADKDPVNVLHKEQPVGLAVGEMNIGLVMQTNLITSANGQVCARPKTLRVDVGFQHNTVYVASELPRRSCAQGEVLTHEEGHVAIDRQLLAEYKPRLEEFARIAADRLGTVKAASPDEAERRMQMFINEQLQAAADQMNKDRSQRQAAHDSTQEYTRLGLVCDGVIAQAVNDYGRQLAGQSSSTSASAARVIAPAPHSPARQPFTRY